MKKINLAFAAMIALVCSCSNDDSTPSPEIKDGTFKGVIFASSITNAEGNNGSTYLQALTDFVPGVYDNRNAIPIGFEVNPIVTESGNIYVFPDYMGNSKAEITRYNLDANGNWIKKGALPVPAGSSACNIVELNSEKAYVSMQSIGMVMAFNPTTMTKITDIDLNDLKQEGTNVSPAVMVIRDDKLFVGLNQMNSQWMPERNTIELAMIDTKTDKLEKHIIDSSIGFCFASRPVDPNSMFMDEIGDIYINCLGSFGFIPQYRGGIVRIKKGETDIDKDYFIALDQTEVKGLTTTYADFLAAIYYGGNGKVYAYANSYGLDPDALTNPYLSMTNIPIIIDLKDKSMSVIEGMEISNPQVMSVASHKNLIVFGSANKKANGFYTYNPTTKEVQGPVIQVSGNPCFFHSFSNL
jgi:hypothetical protein